MAMEPDEDSSRHTKRIDQGILDASREGLDNSRQKALQQEVVVQQQRGVMTQQAQGTSWWNWSYGGGGSPVVSPGGDLKVDMGQQQHQQGTEDSVILQRKTTVSRKFRVP